MAWLITQIMLSEHELLRDQIKELETRRDAIEAEVHAVLAGEHPDGTEVTEPGRYAVTLHPNYARHTPPWRDLLIQIVGKPKVEEIAMIYANQEKRISSTSVRVIDTTKNKE